MNKNTLLMADEPLDNWEGKAKPSQPQLNVPAPAPAKTTPWQGFVKIEKAGTYRIKVGADDYGHFTLGGQTAKLEGAGQYRESAPVTVELEAGWHPASLSHTNIDYKPESGNVARFDSYLDDVQVVLYDIVPNNNKPVICKKDCDGKEMCEDPDAPNEGTSSSSSSSSARMSARPARSTASGSSAGTNIAANATQTSLYWQCSFGLFRGLPGVPGGLLEMVEENFSNRLWSPSALLFRHVLHSTLLKPEAGLSENCMVAVQKGSLLACYFITQGEEDSGQVNNVGYNTRLGNRARMLGEDFTPVVSNPAYIEVTEPGNSKAAYSVETGAPVRFTTASGQQLTPENFSSYMDVVYAEDGTLRQVSNISDGLANVQDVTETGYTLALYLPWQVGAKDEQRGIYAVTGAPFKSFIFARHETEDKVSVTERTPGRNDFVTTWWKNGTVWCVGKGEGENSIHTERTRTDMAEGEWTLLTEIKMGEHGLPVSSLLEHYKSTPQGDLLMSKTEGHGTPLARATTYEYSGDGLLTKETRPDGSETNYEQDNQGRQTLLSLPYGGFAEKRVKTTYCDTKFNDHDPSQETTILRREKQADVQVSKTDYTYTEADHVRRVESSTTAMGGAGARTTITETWLATAPNPYARGRLHMSQGEDGVQKIYSYEASSAYGAAYTVTEETRINGTPVPGQSQKTVTYITAEGNTVREETHILLTDGTWALLDSADYAFDIQNRWNKKTNGNGRVTERELMCDGRTLWERDENGVLTSYSYDSARRLVETIRSAVMDGGNVITPETITSYTRDALGRVIEERTDTGALITVKKTAYDALGRVSSATDALGRTTTYAYSADGLTTTVITPSGATFITVSNPDGSVARQHGTGQRELHHVRDYIGNRIRETVTLADQTTILSQQLENGFGETVTTTAPTTQENGYLYERSTYNALGQLTRRGVDNTAPMLYEYDSFGNVTKETWKLTNTPALSNSRITTYAYSAEAREEGVYRLTTVTTNNGQGTTYTESTAQLISRLSPALESKTIATDGRGNDTVAWTEYGQGAARLQKSLIPASSLTAQAQVIDGYTTTQTDHAGTTSTATRAWTATGIIYVNTDARGNQTTTQTDIAGRVISVTDAAGNATATQHCPCRDTPAVITDAQGHTACYRYDIRGRKTAEWGTGLQPALFSYDEADRMTSVTTFRAEDGDIATDPTGRTDGDTTEWTYHDATGLELNKTCADGKGTVTTYNAFNQTATRTDARGIVTTWTWNTSKGVCTSIAYSDGTSGQQFTYNHLANLYRITDASGTRNITWNIYNEQETDSLTGDGVAHLITEQRDALGRGNGYAYAKAGATQQTTSIGYDNCGRICAAGFLHGGTQRRFNYGYQPGANLLHTLTHPNGITVTHGYENKRDLLTSINATRAATDVVLRGYSYDQLGRPVTRDCARQAKTRHDTFTYNERGELTAATLGTIPYGYGYDNIGNRTTAQEATETTAYESNQLNQYTEITPEAGTPFIPEHDAEGNQTLVQTTTGIWTVIYNAENRPVSFTKTEGDNTTVITCGYDYMGRRSMKKVTVNGTVTQNRRYIYRGYLQIACVDLTRSGHPSLWLITWDPAQPTATRPLAIQKDAIWYTYGHDLTKNVTELYNTTGNIATAYDYTPFGQVTAAGINQPFQWSSEFYDSELGLVYYNYRHYNPKDGRWINRDPIAEMGGWNLYGFVKNNGIENWDRLGLNRYITQFDIAGFGGSGTTNIHVGVAVDKWIDRNGKYVHNGIITYDFAAVLTEETGFWCTVGNILNCISSVIIAKGDIVSSDGLNLESPITVKSSPCQDIEMHSKLEKDKSNPPLYNIVFNSCIIWSTNALQYGMDKKGLGKCCNSDGTLFESNE